LANMVDSQLPEMKTVNLGINTTFIDSALKKVTSLHEVPSPETLTNKQVQLIKDLSLAKERGAHRFICFDRLDPMKGTHTLINAIKLFLDEAEQSEGPSYRTRYHFSCIHELLNISNYDEMNPLNQYIRVCKDLYQNLTKRHPGVVSVCESFTTAGGNRELLPRLIQGSTVIALLGQDGLGLSALEGAYINREQDVGLIIGDQSGCFLESELRNLSSLIFGVRAGVPDSVKEALNKVVNLREAMPGTLVRNNDRYVKSFVIPRTDSMAI
jgi:trehalose-6-phosphate synthase